MTALNAFNCIPMGGNTAVSNCAIDIKSIRGAILLPAGTQFASGSLTSEAVFLAALTTATYAAKTARTFPLHYFEEIKDDSEAMKYDTLGYGNEAPVREGFNKWMFQFIKGGFCLLKQLRKFNNQNVDVLFVDEDGLLFGIKVGTALQGIPTSYVYSDFKVNDGNKVSQYNIKFTFRRNFIDTIGFMQLNPGDFETIVGLSDIVLGSGGARVTNVSLVTGAYSCGGLSLDSVYTTQLAKAGAWVITDSVTGLVVAATSVAYTAGINGWTITLNASDPNYNSGNPVNISLATPAALFALSPSVTGIESNVFTTPN